MARTVKPDEFASKRREILNATQRLVFTKGYEQMSIQDVLNEVRISSGAFHHYFNSRGALLEAFIDKIKQESEKRFIPIIQDPQRTALEKLQSIFDAMDQFRLANSAELIKLLRVWYNDDNALLRQKVDEAVLNQRALLIGEVVRQGVQEGTFTTTYPEKAGEVVVSLLQGMGNTHARLLLSTELENGDVGTMQEIVATHAAYLEAVERVLGAPTNSLRRTNIEAVKVWVRVVQQSQRVSTTG
jgi:AcrR family transcriptional regulator